MVLLDEVKENAVGQDGMALVLVIIVLGLLTVLTTQFGLTVRHHFFVSASYLETSRLNGVVESGLNIGIALLEADGDANEKDTLVDNWATVTNEHTAGLFGRGILKLTVLDESGKLPINRIGAKNVEQKGLKRNDVKDILKKILLSGIVNVESNDGVDNIVDAIQDWIDEDDEEGRYGAESAYYLGLDVPYRCKNGPIGSLDELLLVKGVSAELLNGDGKKPGLRDFLTVYDGEGLININTAPVELLQIIQPLMTETMQQEFSVFRQQAENIGRLGDSRWYLNLPGWSDDVVFPEETITIKSDHFKIVCEGTLEEYTRRLVAVVRRDDENNITLLARHME